MLSLLNNPFGLFDPVTTRTTLRQEIDRLFDQAFTGDLSGSGMSWVPAVELVETENEFRCLVEVPGFAPEDLSITVNDNVLTIEGERKAPVGEQKEGEGTGSYHVAERRYGRFVRSFALPRQVDANGVTAHSEHGLLTVVLPKSPDAKPRRISIRAANGATPKQLTGNSGASESRGDEQA